MDRVTKITLMVIAAGLWANAAAMTIRPARAAYDADIITWLSRIGTDLQAIKNDFHQLIGGGQDCTNGNLCGDVRLPR